MNRTRMEGFTLLEVLTVMVILVIMCSYAVASIKEFAGSIQLRNAIETIAVDIRLARLTARTSAEACYVAYDPATNSYTMNGTRQVNLPKGIKFGVDPTVKGKPSDPGEMPPADGITFESEGIKNRAHFYPKGMVIPTGAVYVTNGKNTMAVTVAITGRTNLWRSCGGNKWISLL